MAPKKRTPKRLHANVDSDSDRGKTKNSFPRFIGLKSLEETPLTKLSPIVIEKVLSLQISPKTVKKHEK